ncbi:hypothetical protein LVW04_25435, partial [Klebsiella pneumoniae]|nr:hypothetical protein [Klebsiella pneumoniae]MCE0349146.1 hypothetical protein [Klebsiella pneumoniae]
GTVCVVGKMRDLILQLSKSSIYSTKPTIIKENGIPVNFYDYEAKSFIVDANKLNKEINLTADYYRTTDDITIGTVRGLLEVVIQEE